MSIFTSWGIHSDETKDIFACDAIITGEKDSYFRAVDIDAPVHVVFSWLCQMKVAPYSYDRLDNAGKKSPEHIIPGVEDLKIGDKMMTIFTIVEFVKDKEITLVMDPPPKKYEKLYIPTAITYQVRSFSPENKKSRVVVKYVATWPKTLWGELERVSVIVADFIMMRRQLLNFKKLAERDFQNSRNACSN